MLDNRVRMAQPPWKYTDYHGIAFPISRHFMMMNFYTGGETVLEYCIELLEALTYSLRKNNTLWKVSKYSYSMKPGGAIIGTV